MNRKYIFAGMCWSKGWVREFFSLFQSHKNGENLSASWVPWDVNFLSSEVHDTLDVFLMIPRGLNPSVSPQAPGWGCIFSQGWLSAVQPHIWLSALVFWEMWVMGTEAHVSTCLHKSNPKGQDASGVKCSPKSCSLGEVLASVGGLPHCRTHAWKEA